jgi:TonB family protein
MKLGICLAAAVAAFLSGPAVARALDEAALGNWALERSPARCVISRQYGPAKAPMTLGFKAPPIGDAIQIVIVRPDDRNRVTQSDAKLTIDSEIVRTTALSYPLGLGRTRSAHLMNLSGDNSARLRRASALEVWVKSAVSGSKGLHRSFSLGPIASAWGQVDSCLARLRQTWNISEDGSRIKEPARMINTEGVFNESDYPTVALGRGQSGTTKIMLLIDEEGMVKDCTLTEASGAAVLDSNTCGVILRRAKFQPAIGLDGKPAKSGFTQHITWRIEYTR